MRDSNLCKISSEVRAALSDRRPIVALESTVIAHGLPRPINLETARKLETIVRGAGATPATIAILNGELRVGLNSEELEFLATNNNVKKISVRDLPIAVAKNYNGATTVASTCWIAVRAGIKVFATGGIGGVHRGTLPDVSADLPQLAETPIIVVCSGAKIVLDLSATREWLETHGVTVIGYRCDEMPAFYSRRSGLSVDIRAESPADVAQLSKAHGTLGLRTGLLVTVPVPADFEVQLEETERVLAEALDEAEKLSISGRDVTPFLLKRMSEKSDGATLKANTALLENNARVAAEIAKSICAVGKDGKRNSNLRS